MSAFILEQEVPLRPFGEVPACSIYRSANLCLPPAYTSFRCPKIRCLNSPPLHELYAALQALYGGRLKQLVLYGSHARGQAHPDSDVPVVLKGEIDHPAREIDRMMEVLYELDLKYDVLISPVPVSSTAYEDAESPLLMNIRREGILVGQEVA